MRTLLIVTALLTATLACGCEDTPAPRAPSTEDAQAAEITRDAAIDMARRDAAVRFRDVRISFANAQPAGRFWVIELRGAGGHGLHYAISKNDGTIRERSMVQ